MTTIAYKDGVIAFDSRSTAGQEIVSDKSNKHLTVNNIHFFTAGSISDHKEFFNSYFGNKEVGKHVNVSGLSWDGKELHRFGCEENRIFSAPMPLDEPCAMGSGTDHALTAMDLGCTPSQAVKMAAKRDTGTGGRVRTFRIKS